MIALVVPDWLAGERLREFENATDRISSPLEKLIRARSCLEQIDNSHSSLTLFIRPKSDHWQYLSVTHPLTDSLTHSCLVNLIDVTLAFEDAYSKLVEVVTVADVSDEDRVGNSLLQI